MAERSRPRCTRARAGRSNSLLRHRASGQQRSAPRPCTARPRAPGRTRRRAMAGAGRRRRPPRRRPRRGGATGGRPRRRGRARRPPALPGAGGCRRRPGGAAGGRPRSRPGRRAGGPCRPGPAHMSSQTPASPSTGTAARAIAASWLPSSWTAARPLGDQAGRGRPPGSVKPNGDQRHGSAPSGSTASRPGPAGNAAIVTRGRSLPAASAAASSASAASASASR